VRPLVLIALLATPAAAQHHTVQAGETLEHVARMYGCSLDEIERANGVTTSLVAQGSVVQIPACGTRRVTTKPRVVNDMSDDDRAAAALATIDGAAVVRTVPTTTTRIRNEEVLPEGEGYHLRRASRGYGASHVVEHLQAAIAEVRALYPEVHTLAIGDLSAREGGKLGNHLSHQTGLDVDVGFYFKRVPKGYPDSFASASDDLDLEATWALLGAFARTAQLDTGVSMIFLDYDVQARLYKWAQSRGTSAEDLEFLFQYPRGRNELAGLVRHWPHHGDHMHVRFKAR
jgi:LysM repeat protein